MFETFIKNKLNVSIYYKVKDPSTGSYENLISSFKLDNVDAEQQIQVKSDDFSITAIKSDEINTPDTYISPNQTSTITSQCNNVSFDENGKCNFIPPEISNVVEKISDKTLKTLSCYSDEELVNDFFDLYDSFNNKIIFESYYDQYTKIDRDEENGSFTINFFNFKNECIFSKKVDGFKTDKNLDTIKDEQDFTACDLSDKQNCDKLLSDNGYSIYEKYICEEIDNVSGECILDCLNNGELVISYKIINLIPYFISQNSIPSELAKIKPNKITKEIFVNSLISESEYFKQNNELDVSLITSGSKLTANISY
jgi:hypothetical protein